MSETEADRRYYEAVEAAFIRRRGTPFLLSPKDFALIKQWRSLGIPQEAIEEGIDEAFTRRQERGATGRVNSLAYCHDAVLAAWERRAEAGIGRGTSPSGEPDLATALSTLGAGLAEAAARRPDLGEPLEGARRSLERLRKSSKSAKELEESLVRADHRLARALLEAVPEGERLLLESEAGRLLEKSRLRMDEQAAEKTARVLLRRLLRERLGLPRLTLLP
jgi:hypothetical protein